MAEAKKESTLLTNSVGKALLEGKSKLDSGSPSTTNILDKAWVKNAFLIPETAYVNDFDIENQYWSTADAKFTDTRLGCNIGINPKPQFTQYSDIPVEGRLAGRSKLSINSTNGNFGMGRIYEQYIDRAAQRIYLTFGTPQYNNLIQFLGAAYNSEQMALARTGRGTSIFYKSGKTLGAVGQFVFFPTVAITILAGKALYSLLSRQTSTFYSLKPQMHLYWNSVNLLVSHMAVNRGIYPRILADEASQKMGTPYKLDPAYLDALSENMPDVFDKNYYLDMFAVASRAQRIANQAFEDEFNELDSEGGSDWEGYVKKELVDSKGHPKKLSDSPKDVSLSAFMDKMLRFTTWTKFDGDDGTSVESDLRSNTDRMNVEKDGFFDYIDSQFRNGSLYATFIVDHTGPVNESWSNSTMESELAQKLNGAVSDIAQARFSLAQGNFLPSNIIQDAVTAFGDFGMGILDGFTGGLTELIRGLSGTGYINVPKHWQSSSVNLPRTNYTMTLISPYGNPISLLMNIDIPMAMIMAGGMPLATGKASYTSPFIAQLYDPGRAQSRLCMIEQFSFTRGVSHLSFSDGNQALAVECSFNIVDLSTIMAMPVSSGSITDTDIGLDYDNILNDYLAVLAGQNIYMQTYPMSQKKLRFSKRLLSLGKFTSPAYYASAFHQSSTHGLLSYTQIGPMVSLMKKAVRNTNSENIENQ